jgi:hypothetical protein
MAFRAHSKKRVRPRYSLRTLFLVITIVAVGLGWTLHEARRQQQVMEKLYEKTCVMGMDAAPEWLPERFDIGQLARVKSLMVGFEEVPELAELSGLTSIYTQGGDFSQLAPMTDLKNVEVLHLTSTQVFDLSPIRQCIKLESLHLDYTPVSDVSPLAGLHSLKELELSGTKVKDLSPLAGLVNLKELWLYDLPTDSSEIAALRKLLPNCEIHADDDPADSLPEASIGSLFEN